MQGGPEPPQGAEGAAVVGVEADGQQDAHGVGAEEVAGTHAASRRGSRIWGGNVRCVYYCLRVVLRGRLALRRIKTMENVMNQQRAVQIEQKRTISGAACSCERSSPIWIRDEDIMKQIVTEKLPDAAPAAVASRALSLDAQARRSTR